jgi:hypothetical protein
VKGQDAVYRKQFVSCFTCQFHFVVERLKSAASVSHLLEWFARKRILSVLLRPAEYIYYSKMDTSEHL